MAIIHLTGELAERARADTLTIDAPRVIDLRRALDARFPGIDATLCGLAVAIDGEIHNDADYQPLRASSEVCFVPKIAGG